ncbi:sensor histidine kinase [Alkalihalobacterium chitinilyticum]|uniref:histidine kinase n=1 Tax=Alkalihalobacterium chitinilyticum TaxID=2980103 RepID=A0ABT5VDK0_9BACI|nr:HAMP domain-containing sensor histidine kinase [Alkalihalobacterium chitinilyticum]MDE5413402.1 cell wall metabolism sensor histidine kinase WalK [Alkalihalobacterium chitinilyticum]
MIKGKGVFSKLFLSYSVIVLLAFFMFSTIFIYLFHDYLYSNYEEVFYHQRDQIVDHLQLAHEKEWDQEVVKASLQMSLNQPYTIVTIYDDNGQVHYQSDSPHAQLTKVDPVIVEASLGGEVITEPMRMNDYLIYLMASPIEIGLENEPIYSMVMIFHEYNHESRQMIFLIIVTVLITIALTGIAIWFISRKITAPLRHMNDIAMQYAKGDFSQNVEVKSEDEVGQLGATFNFMAKELGRLEQMRKDFVANVSHDLRSPLTSINGFLVALTDGTIPKERTNHYYSIMKNETDRLIKLVNDLLSLTQLEAGKISLHPTTYNLSEQIRLTVAKMEPELMKKQIEVEIAGEEDDKTVYADRDRIEQVLVNLMQNAIYYSPHKSTISVVLTSCKDKVRISVEDTGEGIPDDELEHIWDRFYKTDKARSKKVGTGIGLSIVKSIIDLHESSITVQSEVGKGTKFEFTLPIRK